MENTQTTTKTPKLKLDFKDSKYATGRRKRSIARVWIKKGSGNIYVNGIKMNEYFKRPVHQILLTASFKVSPGLFSCNFSGVVSLIPPGWPVCL